MPLPLLTINMATLKRETAKRKYLLITSKLLATLKYKLRLDLEIKTRNNYMIIQDGKGRTLLVWE